jgi:hypothetical protein
MLLCSKLIELMICGTCVVAWPPFILHFEEQLWSTTSSLERKFSQACLQHSVSLGAQRHCFA